VTAARSCSTAARRDFIHDEPITGALSQLSSNQATLQKLKVRYKLELKKMLKIPSAMPSIGWILSNLQQSEKSLSSAEVLHTKYLTDK